MTSGAGDDVGDGSEGVAVEKPEEDLDGFARVWSFFSFFLRGVTLVDFGEDAPLNSCPNGDG